MTDPTPARDDIDAALAARLVAAQFPEWAHLPVRPVAHSGWDNRTFRLGERMSVRLPSAAGYAAQVDKEHRWLPELAPQLPLPIPAPLALGEPGDGYPWRWSVYRWLDGQPAVTARIDDRERFARDVAGFLVALRGVDPTGGPPPGAHNFHRGGRLEVYAEEARRAIRSLAGRMPERAALRVMDEALDSEWEAPPVWLHGDVAVGNLLVRGGELSAVIDFGCCAVGDPACDVVIAWTCFSGTSRDAFVEALALDDATWARGRGWALWKAAIVLAEHPPAQPLAALEAERVIDALLGG